MNVKVNPWTALLLSVIPGMGQFYVGEAKKGLLFLCAFLVATLTVLGSLSEVFRVFPFGDWPPSPALLIWPAFFILVVLPVLVVFSAVEAWRGATLANRQFLLDHCEEETDQDTSTSRPLGVTLLLLGVGSLFVVSGGYSVISVLRFSIPPALVLIGFYVLLGESIRARLCRRDGQTP